MIISHQTKNGQIMLFISKKLTLSILLFLLRVIIKLVVVKMNSTFSNIKKVYRYGKKYKKMVVYFYYNHSGRIAIGGRSGFYSRSLFSIS